MLDEEYIAQQASKQKTGRKGSHLRGASLLLTPSTNLNIHYPKSSNSIPSSSLLETDSSSNGALYGVQTTVETTNLLSEEVKTETETIDSKETKDETNFPPSILNPDNSNQAASDNSTMEMMNSFLHAI